MTTEDSPRGEVVVDALGPLRVRRDGVELALGGAKQRTVLALLALEAGRIVPVERIISTLWGVDPPEKALGTLQVYVSNLRRILGPGTNGKPLIAGRSPGYVLDVDPEQVDVARFSRDVAAARERADAGNIAEAVSVLRSALGLWRGSALSDLGDSGGTVRAKLDAFYLSALRDCLELELRSGDHARAVPELQSLVDAHPLDEGLWKMLMLSLYRSGRQADALAAYRRMQLRLDEDLGIEPSIELRDLEAAILAQSPALMEVEAPARKGDRTERVRPSAGKPAWLVFTDGRRAPITEGHVVIGRADDCDITLSDPSVSRRHAIVRAGEDGHSIEDDGSTNGTRVDGVELPSRQPQQLRDGAQISIGSVRLQFTSSP